MKPNDVRNAKDAARKKGIAIPEPASTSVGAADMARAILEKHPCLTLPELGTAHEAIYTFTDGFYRRGEPLLKEKAEWLYAERAKLALERALASGDEDRINKAINMDAHGLSIHDAEEILGHIRRMTFTDKQMNPPTHISFENGNLNLQTWSLEPPSPELFITYSVRANYSEKYTTLVGTPLFARYLHDVYYDADIPMVLSYMAYSLYPGFPRHKVLFLLGRERIGKGVIPRILNALAPEGYGSLALDRLLTVERFPFSGLMGKNVAVDAEMKRKYKRGTSLDWGRFNNLFGQDIVSFEPKGKEAHDAVFALKGWFLGNLPIMDIDNPAAIARILLVQTRDKRATREIVDLDGKIMESERDAIAALLMQILHKLIANDFWFPGELLFDSTAELLEQLADPVANFIEEETEYSEGATVAVDDAFARFGEWCSNKGIPIIARQTFSKKFGRTYEKKRIGPKGKQVYVFTDCVLNENTQDVRNLLEVPFEVGYHSDDGETPEISRARDRYRGIQHASMIPRMEKENDHVTCIKDKVQKLDTTFSGLGTAENKASLDTKPVSNFKRESGGADTQNPSDSHPEPVDSTVQSENPFDPGDSVNRIYFYRVTLDMEGANPDPVKYPMGAYLLLTAAEAQHLKTYQFCTSTTEQDFVDNASPEAMEAWTRLKGGSA